MNFRVNRPFKLNGIVRMPGQTLELDIARAGRLRAMGLIGLAGPERAGPERAVKPPAERPMPYGPEQAVKKPAERRGRKAKKEQKAEKDVADLSDPSGD